MRAAIVVLAAVLLWLLLRKRSQGDPLPSSGDPEAGRYPLPTQPVDPGPGDTVQAYDGQTIVGHDQDGNEIDFHADGTITYPIPGWDGEQPLTPARPRNAEWLKWEQAMEALNGRNYANGS